ncbi:ATP-binding protein, partial [Thermodesulfobacteriota bacterium]
IFIRKIHRQLVKNLIGLTSSRFTFSDGDFDEKVFVEQYIVFNLEKANYYHAKLISAYFFEKMENQLSIAEKAMAVIASATAYPTRPNTYFLAALIYLWACSQANRKDIETYLTKVDEIQTLMKTWADHCEANYLHKYLLIEAEKARVQGEDIQAMKLYDQAIESARKYDYINNQAIGNEVAAKFYLSRGLDKIAAMYMKDAHFLFGLWGAAAKVKQIEEKYPELIGKVLSRDEHGAYLSGKTSTTSTTDFSQRLDLDTIIKASQTISGEIVLANLLTRMIRICMENAGAEKGMMILKKEGQLFVEAEAVLGETSSSVLKSIPVEAHPGLSAGVVQYAARTQEMLILSDAAKEPRFASDPYIMANKPKSILCAPIIRHNELIGMVYLENNVADDVFTVERISVLNLLSAQAAISIENAGLYDSMEKTVAQRTAQLNESNRQLEQAKIAAETANQAKSEFLANISHEIRTPINAVLGFSEILFNKETEESKKNYLHSIIVSGKALLSLINDILDLSKVEAGKLELAYTPVSPRLLFHEMEIIFKEAIRNKGLKWIIDIPADLPESLLLDEIRLRQVLINLVGNAVKFTQQGHIKLCAEILYSDENHKNRLDLIFSIEDTGVGIPENQLESIFQPFTQTKGQDASKFGGAGLGLSISSRLIEMMNGDITVKSRVGKGSVFRVRLNGIAMASLDQQNSLPTEDIDFDSIRFEKASILIVDDIAENRDLLNVFLEDFGFTLLLAANGKEAIDAARKFRPQLILLDMKMPVMDGYEALDMIKRDDGLKKIPVIAMSASSIKEVGTFLFDSQLRRPFSKTDLISELMKHLPCSTIIETSNDVAGSGPLDAPLDLTGHSPEYFSDLLEILFKKQTRCRQIYQQGAFDKMENLAVEMLELSKEYDFTPLNRWTEDLLSAVNAVDIEKMGRLVSDLSSLTGEFENRLNNPTLCDD